MHGVCQEGLVVGERGGQASRAGKVRAELGGNERVAEVGDARAADGRVIPERTQPCSSRVHLGKSIECLCSWL